MSRVEPRPQSQTSELSHPAIRTSAPGPDRHPPAADIAAAALLGLAVLVIALRGGSYDVVARSETSVLIWWVLGLGVALGLLPRARAPATLRVSVAALLALVVWSAVGLAWTSSAERTVLEAARVLGAAGAVALVAGAFTPRGWRLAVASLTVAAVIVCALALLTRLVPGLVSQSETTAGGITRTRLAYPFGYWNALAAWSAMTVGLTLAWSAHAPRWWARGAALAGACIAVGVVYLTYSRAGAVSVAVAAVAVVALAAHRWLSALNVLIVAAGSAAIVLAVRSQPAIADGTGSAGAGLVAGTVAGVAIACLVLAWAAAAARVERMRLGRRPALVIAGACAVVAVGAGALAAPAAVHSAWESFEHPPVPARDQGDPAGRLTTLSGDRIRLWRVALDDFRAHPVRGIGAGTYEFSWNRSAEERTHHVRDAHSLYLETLAELGAPGGALVVLALGSLVVGAVRTRLRQRDPVGVGAAAACVVALIVFCVTAAVDWMWEMTGVALAALACGALAAAARSRPAARPRLSRRLWLGALALLMVVAQLPVLGSQAGVRASEDWMREGDAEEALAQATHAVDLAPWSSSAYLQRALVLERTGVLGHAAGDARKAADREPTNWVPWLTLARIEAERGRVAAALAAAARARQYNPRSPLFSAATGRGSR